MRFGCGMDTEGAYFLKLQLCIHWELLTEDVDTCVREHTTHNHPETVLGSRAVLSRDLDAFLHTQHKHIIQRYE